MSEDAGLGPESEAFLRHMRLCYWRLLSLLDDRAGASGLSDRQLLFLRALQENGPLPSRRISGILRVTPPNVTGLSQRLVNKGFIVRGRPAHDRRVVTFALTMKGRDALAAYTEWRQQRVESLLRSIPPRERKALLSGLGKVLDQLDALDEK